MGQPTEEDRDLTRDYVAANREALERSYHAVVRACRGRLVGPVNIGMDPAAEPGLQWWARVRLTGGRAGHKVLVEGKPSGLAALEALGSRISLVLTSERARR